MARKTTRRGLILGGAAVLAGGAAVGWDLWKGEQAYAAMLARMTAPLPDAPAVEDLVRYATLAASGHNAQPWRFRSEDGALAIAPDLRRRTPVVDPDDHHLWASLGCAAETLGIAARSRGLGGGIAFAPASGGRVLVDLSPGPREEDARFAAIPERQSTRSLYDGSGLSPDTADRLLAASRSAGAEALWIDDAGRREALLALIIEGNTRQTSDLAFVGELKQWLRFNAGEAARRGDGLYSAAAGNPELPTWAGKIAFDIVFSTEAENAKTLAQARSSAGFVVIVAPEDSPRGWVAAGRAVQALMLEATALGLRTAFLNQAVEVRELRAEVQGLLGLGTARPSLILRVGRAPAMPRSPRRPVPAVLEA